MTHPKTALDDHYPEGAYGYTLIDSMIMNFKKPVQLHSMYLKKHRSTEFYLKNSVTNFIIEGHLNGKQVMTAFVQAFSNQWKMYTPKDDLIVDQLIFPPGMDIDNLLLGIDMNSEESMIQA